VAVVDADPYAEVKERLRTDWPFYAESFLRIVDRQRIVPFVPKPAQLRLWNALVAQRDSGRPMRGYVLKARKIGFSTMGQGLGLQRVTQRPNHSMLTVAQDNATAQELFAIAELMYANVPDHEALRFLKPKITHQRRSRALHFGEDSRQRLAGQLGLNSKMLVDTANEFEAGRGFTYHTLLLSEVAFWADLKKKLTSLLNTVPHDDPDTLVLMESTANGHDYFKWLWDQAEAGNSDYLCFFSPWFEDEKYRRRFADETERAEFIEGLGQGAWGEDEPDLRTLIADSVVGWAAELNTTFLLHRPGLRRGCLSICIGGVGRSRILPGMICTRSTWSTRLRRRWRSRSLRRTCSPRWRCRRPACPPRSRILSVAR
jgi:hypothetical protein